MATQYKFYYKFDIGTGGALVGYNESKLKQGFGYIKKAPEAPDYIVSKVLKMLDSNSSEEKNDLYLDLNDKSDEQAMESGLTEGEAFWKYGWSVVVIFGGTHDPNVCFVIHTSRDLKSEGSKYRNWKHYVGALD